jgi:hypothetical protein
MPSAVMQTYLKAVQGRLKSETSGNATGQGLNGAWLIEHLKGNNWWLRKERAKWVCGKLHVQFSEPEYYRDILIWLPDVRWGAVALLGNKLDSKTKQPLFNKAAWKKANNVLREILDGNASDPPGFSFYTVRLDSKGEPKKNKYGFEILDCNRGTNDVENIHKTLLTVFGTWHVGVEMSDCLLTERRHRHNHKVSERRRLGFPRIGHYDTWLIDALQILVEKNHGVLLYPFWSNASDYKETSESFDTVALHTKDLAAAVSSININDSAVKLTRDQNHLCKSMGSKLPFLPVDGEVEVRLFHQLVLNAPFDEDEMAIEWCKHVDGTFIFPKFPVHLRTYRE